MPTTNPSRRQFVKRATAASAFAFQVVPSSVWGANERLQVACIGIGGKGASDLGGVAKAGARIVALCDVDENRRVRKKNKDARAQFPDAPFYRDFREMLASESEKIDGVTVSTPDHAHCHAAVAAMQLGKHVYCQKPLSHSVWEARLMTTVAKARGVHTQMGNQAHAGEPIRRAVEWIRAGIIGKVTEVHAWTNRPIWPQGLAQRPEPAAVPAGLDWNLWLGPAPERPYSPDYVPFKWRGWWDFGTGALGDMGCHIMDMPFWALDLKHPVSVEADSDGNTAESGPKASTVTYRFPAGPYSEDLKFAWYDGGRMPSEDLFAGTGITPASARKFDLVMVGTEGKFFFNRNSTKFITYPRSILEDFKAPEPTIQRVKDEDQEWVDACLGGPKALSNFDYSGPFSETVVLGNLAIRLGKKIEWDGPNMVATNAPEAAELIRRPYRQGWELEA